MRPRRGHGQAVSRAAGPRSAGIGRGRQAAGRGLCIGCIKPRPMLLDPDPRATTTVANAASLHARQRMARASAIMRPHDLRSPLRNRLEPSLVHWVQCARSVPTDKPRVSPACQADSMPARQRQRDQAIERARAIRIDLGRNLRVARLDADLSLSEVGPAAGMSTSQAEPNSNAVSCRASPLSRQLDSGPQSAWILPPGSTPRAIPSATPRIAALIQRLRLAAPSDRLTCS